jgi:hypothetical protein
MNTKKFLIQWGIILSAGFVLVGCGNKTPQVDAGAFGQAAPEIKTIWDQAAAADKANDYFKAATGYNQLVAMESKLTQKQFDSAVAASRDLMQRMTAAADGGDAAAKEALAKLMESQRGR